MPTLDPEWRVTADIDRKVAAIVDHCEAILLLIGQVVSLRSREAVAEINRRDQFLVALAEREFDNLSTDDLRALAAGLNLLADGREAAP
jgi:hypothetical protein